MNFGSIDGERNSEYNGVGLVELSRLFGAQDTIFSEMLSLWHRIVCGMKKFPYVEFSRNYKS